MAHVGQYQESGVITASYDCSGVALAPLPIRVLDCNYRHESGNLVLHWNLLVNNHPETLQLYNSKDGSSFNFVEETTFQPSENIQQYIFKTDNSNLGSYWKILCKTDGVENPKPKVVYAPIPEGQKVQVFPNPANDFFNINGVSPKRKVVIFNSVGFKMYSSSMNVSERIYCGDWPNGNYLIMVETDLGLKKLETLVLIH